MEDMYNMKNVMQMHSYCPRVSCPMMVLQPSIPNYVNYNMKNNTYGSAFMNCEHMHMYGAGPRSTMAKAYFFHTEMRPVPIEEIED